MKNFLIKIYQFINCFTEKHMNQIYLDINKYNNIPKKAFFIALEINNGLKMFCLGVNFEAVSQSLIILRQLTEQVCFLNIISNHNECFEAVELFSKLKLDSLRYDLNSDINIKKKYKESKDLISQMYSDVKKKFPKTKKLTVKDFLDYGWMLEITDECGVEKLYGIANFKEIKKWRTYLNSLVHNTFSFYQNDSNEQQRLIIEATYFVMSLLDVYMYSYHNLTDYEFIIDNNNFRDNFISLYDEFITLKKNNKF